MLLVKRVVNRDGVRVTKVVARQHLTLSAPAAEMIDALENMESVLDRDYKANPERLVNIYMAVLKDAGWTLQSMADVMHRTCEMVRLRIKNVDELNKQYIRDLPKQFPIPEPPYEFITTTYHVPVEPDAKKLERLLELKPLAARVRSSSPKYRVEAEEYSKLLAEVHLQDGITLYHLAKRLGVSHGALRFRLVRYGYIAR